MSCTNKLEHWQDPIFSFSDFQNWCYNIDFTSSLKDRRYWRSCNNGYSIVQKHKSTVTESMDPESRPPGFKSLDKSLSLSVTQFLYLANADTNNSNPYLRELLWWLNELLYNQGHLSLLHLMGVKVTKFPALTPI